MNLLLDTHILLWHLADNPKLSLETSALIENDVHNKFVSIVSLWEIEIKRNIGKLDVKQPIETLLPTELIVLPLKVEHVAYLKNLPFHHKDPFDRIMIAQAIVEDFTMITDDEFFSRYDVKILEI